MQAGYGRPYGTSTDFDSSFNKSKSSARRGSDSGTAPLHQSDKTSVGKADDKDKQAGGGLQDEDIPKSDWGRTLDTAVSIPEGPEERADEHEANASLEHALGRGMTGDDTDGAMVLVASKGGVDMTTLNVSADA